jgi:hypothetical protein
MSREKFGKNLGKNLDLSESLLLERILFLKGPLGSSPRSGSKFNHKYRFCGERDQCQGTFPAFWKTLDHKDGEMILFVSGLWVRVRKPIWYVVKGVKSEF